jgi:chromosome segregation protein
MNKKDNTYLGYLQNVVTEKEEDAKRAIEYLKHNNLGRASFLPISSVNGRKLTQNFKSDTRCYRYRFIIN